MRVRHSSFVVRLSSSALGLVVLSGCPSDDVVEAGGSEGDTGAEAPSPVDPLDGEFETLAQAVFGPLLAAMEESRPA